MTDTLSAASIAPQYFGWHVEDRVAVITLNRPERKNPLTLESYRELTDTFLTLQKVPRPLSVVVRRTARAIARQSRSSGADRPLNATATQILSTRRAPRQRRRHFAR